MGESLSVCGQVPSFREQLPSSNPWEVNLLAQRERILAKNARYRAAQAINVVKDAYRSARYRCTSPKAIGWLNYGGRGIKFLFKTFEEFFAELGPRPAEMMGVDRINVEGHYEPGNVRWATLEVQNRNKRRSR